MIDITPEHLAEVRRVLSEHAAGLEVWAFGSRVNGGSGKNSDLDLAIVGKNEIGWKFIERLKDAFASSDLPFMVDVVDYQSLESGLAKIVREKHDVIQTAKNPIGK